MSHSAPHALPLRPLLALLATAVLAGLAGCGGITREPVASQPHLDGGTCALGLLACGGRCTSLLTDNANCGKCGSACAVGTACQGGVCRSAGNDCTGGQVKCGGTCTDLTSDAANCGVCGAVCRPDEKCALGQCVAGGGTMQCPPGQITCANQCVDVMTDAANCGACGAACNADETCDAGSCVLVGGGGGGGGGGVATCGATVTCLNACAPNDNACAQACLAAASPAAQKLLDAVFTCLEAACPSSGGGVCDSKAKNYSQKSCDACYSTAQAQGGRCAASLNACLADGKGGGGGGCPQGQTSCGGKCVSLASDAANCGACGKACALGQLCQAGVCVGGNNKATGCNGAVACLNKCVTQQCQQACVGNATPQGKQLLTALLNCLEATCPSSGGGVCDELDFFYDPRACDACYTKAQGANGVCAKPLNACLADLP